MADVVQEVFMLLCNLLNCSRSLACESLLTGMENLRRAGVYLTDEQVVRAMHVCSRQLLAAALLLDPSRLSAVPSSSDSNGRISMQSLTSFVGGTLNGVEPTCVKVSNGIGDQHLHKVWRRAFGSLDLAPKYCLIYHNCRDYADYVLTGSTPRSTARKWTVATAVAAGERLKC